MRAAKTVWIVLFGVACGGGDKTSETDTDSPAPKVALAAEAAAQEVEIELPQDLVEAQRVVSTFMAAQLAAVLEPNVHLALGVPEKPVSSPCWVTGPPQTSFTVDYSGCGSTLALGGVLSVQKRAFGPLTLGFLQYEVNERQVDGTLAVEEEGADAGHFATWDTSSASPGPESRAPIGIQTGFSTSSLSWEGGMELDTAGNRLSQWGLATVQGTEGTSRTIRVGGTDEAALTGAVPPEDPLEASLSYVTCRCPDSGRIAYDLDARIQRVIVDLDALELEDDGVDDPLIRMEVDLPLEGEALVETVECGQYQVSVDLGAMVVDLPGQQVASRIQQHCHSLAIEESRCNALVTAASEQDFQFTVAPESLAAAVQAAVNVSFDSSWCMF